MKFKRLHNNFELPSYATNGSAGFDIAVMEDVTIYKGVPVVVDLGFAATVPHGCVAIIAPRSGKGFNDGLTLVNTVGVIDSDYTGEWKAKLILNKAKLILNKNVSNDNFVKYVAGERILQCLILPVNKVKPELVDELELTDRGGGGFGSTGK